MKNTPEQEPRQVKIRVASVKEAQGAAREWRVLMNLQQEKFEVFTTVSHKAGRCDQYYVTLRYKNLRVITALLQEELIDWVYDYVYIDPEVG